MHISEIHCCIGGAASSHVSSQNCPTVSFRGLCFNEKLIIALGWKFSVLGVSFEVSSSVVKSIMKFQ